MCYAERYPDLLQGYCNGDLQQCQVEALCLHFEQHGEVAGLVWGCPPQLSEQDRKDAECYAERYPNLWTGYCQEDRSKCQHNELYEHYHNYGVHDLLIWGCRNRNIVPARPVWLPTSNSSYATNITTGTQQEKLELHILVFETSAEKAAEMKLAAQSLKAGIHFSVFGVNTTFEGFGTKWEVVQPVLRAMPQNALVAIVDGRDVLLNIHRDDPHQGKDVVQGVIDSYLALTHDKPGAVVMSTEGQCCVAALTFVKPGDYFTKDGKRNVRACPSGEEGCLWAGDANKIPWEDFMLNAARETTGVDSYDVYLNSGLVAGRPKDLLNIIRIVDFEKTEDDQAVFTDFMYNFPHLIALDYAQQIFGNARWTKGMEGGGCPFERRGDAASDVASLMHRETTTMPLFLHGPGKFFECLEFVADQIGHGPEPIQEQSAKTHLRLRRKV